MPMARPANPIFINRLVELMLLELIF